MPKDNVLTQEDFDALLHWFAPDREKAGAKYEEIRNGLIRYFYFKGCAEAEALADETINRVARKLSVLNIDNDNKHITYFYGFAAKIHLEYRNRLEKTTVEFQPNLHQGAEETSQPDNRSENKHFCLEECLAKLPAPDRELVVQYFSKEKKEKFEHRRQLAEKLQINVGTMHVRIHRLKAALKTCLERCLKGK